MITAWAMFEGGENASIGLFCNNITGQNSNNYHYVLLISRSGGFSLDYRTSPTEGYRTNPTEGDLTILETLTQGQTDVLYPPGPGVWNSIQAACIDQHLMFFVNGETLIDITLDHPVEAGTVGLVQATGAETEYLKVTWDMLNISEP